MKYFILYIFMPAIVAFAIQTALCHMRKRGTLRHGSLILPIIYIALGVITLLAQSGDAFFGGLGAIAAVLWFISAGCAAFGYGVAWLVYLITKRRKK